MRQHSRAKAEVIVVGLALAIGVVLCLIGLRFLLAPRGAAGFFGIDPRNPGFAPHAAIGLRDLWLGALLAVFALLRDWRAAAVWLALASLVCFGDALIAWGSSGRWVSVAFHAGSGLFCAGLAAAAWRGGGGGGRA